MRPDESHLSDIPVDKLNHLISLLPSSFQFSNHMFTGCQCNPKQERSELPLAATTRSVTLSENK